MSLIVVFQQEEHKRHLQLWWIGSLIDQIVRPVKHSGTTEQVHEINVVLYLSEGSPDKSADWKFWLSYTINIIFKII